MVIVIGSVSLEVVVVSRYQIWSCRISDVPSGRSVRVVGVSVFTLSQSSTQPPAISANPQLAGLRLAGDTVYDSAVFCPSSIDMIQDESSLR